MAASRTRSRFWSASYVAPSGLEKYFAEFGDPVPTRTSPAPSLSDAEREERVRRAIALAPEYGMEFVLPPDE